MPIVVEHQNEMPSLIAAIQFALAQKQSQDQQAAQQQSQQGGIQNAISQLAPILAARQAAQQSQQPPSYAMPGQLAGPPPPHPDQPQYVRPTVVQQPADHSSSLLQAALGTSRQNDRLSNDDLLAAFHANQQSQHDANEAQLAQQRLDQQNSAIAMTQGDISARWAAELPSHVQQGLADGSYRYSPAQKKQLADITNAINAVDVDPRFSPEERERFKAQRWQEYKAINSSPMPVPPDEQPVTPAQQLARSIVMRPVQIDENTTVQIPTVPVQRAGGIKWDPTPDGQLTMKLAIIRAQGQARERLAQIHGAAKPDPFLAQQQKILQQQQRTQLDKLKQRKPTPAQFTTTDTDPKSSTFGKRTVDYGAYNAAREKWQSEYEHAVDQQFAPTLDGIANQPNHDAFDATAAHAGILGSGAPEDQQLPVVQQQPPTPPQSPPTLSDHPDDGRAQWDSLGVGEVTTLPDGRTVRKTGDTSFEPVQ